MSKAIDFLDGSTSFSNNLRVSEIIMEIAKSKSAGKLNLLQNKNKKKKYTTKEKIYNFLSKIKRRKK